MKRFGEHGIDTKIPKEFQQPNCRLVGGSRFLELGFDFTSGIIKQKPGKGKNGNNEF
jgi:hypothetical protein